jgi:DNA (cytosine-5)-methyltransferase 1
MSPAFTFIDLFAGIGGFRLALEDLGGRCVFSSEWDKYAQITYEVNHGEKPYGDITTKEVRKFIPPSFDLLCAGFPCQAFSIAGRRGGFQDVRGTLFFDVADIILKHQPKAFFLENVKGLQNHDRGRTLATILTVLRNDLGYTVPKPQIVNAKYFGVPQNRERVFIAGFRSDYKPSNFSYPHHNGVVSKLGDILEDVPVSVKYYLSDQYLSTLKKHKERHKNRGNGFGFEVLAHNSIANALVVGGMGKERNLIVDHRLESFEPVTNIRGTVNREGVRRLTPREYARLQGFPDQFQIVVSDTQAYKQFGNSVAVPAIKAMAQNILRHL